jgi:Ser/Thr protein kinase RdoA (MazF antagonist)
VAGAGHSDPGSATTARGAPTPRSITAHPCHDSRTLWREQRTEQQQLAALIAGLDERLAKVASCGLPDTLIHGDLHPGNVRSDGGPRVLIDWGDSFIGHPAFDVLRLTEKLPGRRRPGH